jgi:hypothetical protein
MDRVPLGGSEFGIFALGGVGFQPELPRSGSFCGKLLGPYYRWTGFLEGKRTTKTLTPQEARECRRRIAHHRALEKQIHQLIRRALQDAPWTQR